MKLLLSIFLICMSHTLLGQNGCYAGGIGDGAATAVYKIQPLRNNIRSITELPFKVVNSSCIITNTTESGKMQLFNPLGELIFETNFNPLQTIDLPLTIHSVYILRVQFKSQTFSKIFLW